MAPLRRLLHPDTMVTLLPYRGKNFLWKYLESTAGAINFILLSSAGIAETHTEPRRGSASLSAATVPVRRVCSPIQSIPETDSTNTKTQRILLAMQSKQEHVIRQTDRSLMSFQAVGSH
jgi:hypothetical protein